MTFPGMLRVSWVMLLCWMAQSCTPPATVQEDTQVWPLISAETKPWTRWWWHGNVVTKEGITAEMEAYQRAGIGGLEITPIYGVYGEEERFVDFLSPEWMELLVHVFTEAERLDMGIDMATGTGWPFGGPWVGEADACKALRYKTFDLKGGSSLKEKIEFIQTPYLRLVGNNIYRPDESGEVERVFDTSKLTVRDIADPINTNTNLQQLAIDQIQFEKPLKLVCLMGYNERGDVVDLGSKVDASGMLNWIAPEGNWKLYAVFEGFHGKMVERAGPGGEGNVIDHFSEGALSRYLDYFDRAFQSYDIKPLRAFFNDSYEVDDARGAADFTPALFEEFKTRRGYDLRHELPALFGQDTPEKNQRVLCDYRETLSDLLLEKFTRPWKEWAHEKEALVRNQAHGSPSNILDLYAVVDIPEIEGTEPLRFKMATSSGNVSGKKLVSAEAATWLNEHFESSLGDVREAVDKFLLHGVNHIVYHGSCYSPPDDPWPGRLFYAAVHLNTRNPQWRDFYALNSYIARCQSFLQNSSPSNDVLLYLPIYDRFSSPGREMVEHFDGIGGFAGSSFEEVAERLLETGFAFDYISDKQLAEVQVREGGVVTAGNSRYKAVVIPRCDYMPLNTIEKLSQLRDEGVPIIFVDRMPRSVNGWYDLEARAVKFADLAEKLKTSADVSRDVTASLEAAGVQREAMIDLGVRCLRKNVDNGNVLYFLKNEKGSPYTGWIPLAVNMERVAMYDPMTGRFGKARTRKGDNGTEVWVDLERSETVIIADRDVDAEFPYRERSGDPVTLKGKWRVTFDAGGPSLPQTFERDTLIYWTDVEGEGYRDFSGTATYTFEFSRPSVTAGRWLLTIDSVRSTAEVVLNGRTIGTLMGPVFQVTLDSDLLQDSNILEIKVSNLMANRIAYMDRNKVFWKKFYNINFAARLRENARKQVFDASHWEPRPSGLAGQAMLIPLK